MPKRLWSSGMLAALFVASALAVSFAAPPSPHAPVPIPMPTMRPFPTPLPFPGSTPTPTPAPGTFAPNSINSTALMPQGRIFRTGRRVPLASLPPLPPKTPANTLSIGLDGRRRLSANGATINYLADTFGNSACSSAVGTLIPVGCDVFWQSVNLPGGTTWDDYFIDAGSTTAVESSGGTYTGGSGPTDDTPNLNTAGTAVLATLNVTTNRWEDVVYITVGNVNYFGTYADSGATIPQTQFTAANGTNVYINAAGLTQGDYYVAYVESTSGSTFCEYIAPPGTPSATTFCDPTTSPGIQAVIGAQSSAAITAVWPLSSATPTGTYSVVLYNLTTKTRMAQRQVSITKTGSTGAITLVPTSGNGALPADWPTPPPTRASATKFAFDSTADQSDKSWTMNATGLAANKNYTWTVSDPTGQVITNTNFASSGTGTASHTFNFANAQSPGNYIGNTYTVQMLNQSTNTVDASQAFQILGYNVLTEFTNPTGTAVVLPQGSSVTSGLEFLNDGDTFYGTGNGDTISGLAFNTGGNGITISFTTGTITSCGATCTQETVADSKGQNWTVQINQFGGGANAGSWLSAYPATAGQSLAMNANLTVPGVQFSNAPGNSRCTSGCTGLTSILPTDGDSWSQNNNSSSTNPVYYTNGGGKSYTGTASVSHIGYRNSGNTFFSGFETHGYAPNTAQAIYTATSPFTSPSGASDVWNVTVTNNASLGTTNITELQIILPTAYTPSGTTTFVSIDGSSPSNWQTTNCPAGAVATAFCIKTSGGNGGIPPSGGSPGPSNTQQIYIDLTPPPPGAYSYTDWGIQAVTPTPWQMTPSGTFTAFVGSVTALDSTATASYSLNGTLITPGFSPTSEGQNTNNSVTITVQNASTAQDPFPDYLDAITIDLPSTNTFSGLSGMPTGWSLLGTSSPGGGLTRYWFGLCASQFNTGDGPVSAPPPVNPTLPSCGAGTEANSIAPGKNFTVTGNLQTGTSNITGTMYAHGANVAGWSSSHTFTLNVTAVSATAGFSGAGGYPTATTVTSPQTPQVGADADSTNGNAYVYNISNTSGAGNNITSAVITIPGQDTSFVTPADGTGSPNTPWTIEGTPTISGTTYNCSITSFSSATQAGANGAINIGGGSCAIPPGKALTIDFNAKSPYTVNDTYRFSTTVNGSVAAAEQWSTDTIVQIILAANLSIAVDPSNPGPGGSTPSVSCVPCTYNIATELVNFGTVVNAVPVTGSDVVRVSVYTNAGTTVGWKLYVDTNSNPANTGSPTNELLTSIDSTRSAPTSGVNFDQTTQAVIPTTSPGMVVMDTGSGTTARRLPFDAIMNYQINIQGGPLTPQTSVVTYTFISN